MGGFLGWARALLARDRHDPQRFTWREMSFAPLLARDIEGRRLDPSATIFRRRKDDDSGWEYRQEPESHIDRLNRVGW